MNSWTRQQKVFLVLLGLSFGCGLISYAFSLQVTDKGVLDQFWQGRLWSSFETENFQESLDLDQSPTEIQVDFSNGDVDIIPSTDGKTHLFFEGVVQAHLSEKPYHLTMKDHRLEISMESKREERSLWGFHWSGFVAESLNLKIALPKEKLKSLNVTTVNGDIDLANIKSEGVKAVTTSGYVKISSTDVNDVQLETISGDISTRLASPKNLKATTVSGDVQISLGADRSYNFALETVSGEIKNRFHPRENTSDKATPHEVAVQTVSGDIKIESNQGIE